MGCFPIIDGGVLASTYGKIYGGIYSWNIYNYKKVICSKCSTLEKAIYEKKYEDSLVLVAYFYLRIKDMQQDHRSLCSGDYSDDYDYDITQENFNQMLDDIFWERLISLCDNDKVLALEIFNDVQEKYLERGRKYIISKYIDFKNRENKEEENIKTIKEVK